MLKKAVKAARSITVGDIDLAPATVDGLKSGDVSVTLDRLLDMQGFMPVMRCVVASTYRLPGPTLDTDAGVVTGKTIDVITKLIDAGHPPFRRAR